MEKHPSVRQGLECGLSSLQLSTTIMLDIKRDSPIHFQLDRGATCNYKKISFNSEKENLFQENIDMYKYIRKIKSISLYKIGQLEKHRKTALMSSTPTLP